MKLPSIIYLIPVVVLMKVQAPLFAQTPVSGIISTNTTWTRAGSPYNLTGTVQVMENVTLTIESGVTINGSNQKIEVFGALSAVGNSDSKIIFNYTSIDGSPLVNYFAILNIQHANFTGGGILASLVSYTLSLTLRDCRFSGCSVIYLINSVTSPNNYIERNVFVNSGGIDTWIIGNGIVYVRNNVFYQQSGGFAIQNKVSSFSATSTVAEYNSFLSTNRVAINLPTGYSEARVSAVSNYWNTTDVNVINSMIVDRNDNLQIASVVPYLPFLLTPHANTPAFPLISTSQSVLNFGNVNVGLSSTLNFTLKNTSSGSLAITDITSSNPRFSVAPRSANLDAGDSLTINVSFSPTTFGAQNGTLAITHNAENSIPSISVSGTGISPSIALTPPLLDFGKVRVGQSQARSVQISNVGNSLMTVDSIVSSNTIFEIQTAAFAVAAGASTSKTLTYRPAAIGKDSAAVLVYHNAPASPSSIILRGEGVRSNLILSPKSIVFNKVGYKPWIDTALVFTNLGGDTLRVTSVTSDNPVFISNRLTFTIPSSQSFSDTIRFSPIDIGAYSGRLLILSDSPTSPDTVLLSGTREVLSHAEGPADLPAQYILNQNYPNPFNPSTTISFSLAQSGFTTISIFNILGQQIHELIAVRLPAGAHTFTWTPSDLPSGVYFYQLSSGDFTQINKMVYIR
jgi:hypothetical protein